MGLFGRDPGLKFDFARHEAWKLAFGPEVGNMAIKAADVKEADRIDISTPDALKASHFLTQQRREPDFQFADK